jgi:methylmalonyl-CoA/ethylmalonyl-CoA epimerase
MASVIKLDEFDHFGYVVKDAKATAESWTSKLGAGEWKFTDAGALTLAHAMVGSIQYELLAPVAGQPSLWSEFLENHGEGPHHMCYKVADVEEAVENIIQDGGRRAEYAGKPIMIPKWMAYLETGGPGGVLIELLRTRKPK